MDIPSIYEKIGIIYQDKDLLIVNKPAGLVVTTEKSKSKAPTLEDFLKEINPQLERSGIVHRLDKGTSGLMVVAKNTESLKLLKQMFKERKVKKVYWAMLCGDVSTEGTIKVPIGRSAYGFGKFGVTPEGKEALTNFKLIGKYKHEGKVYSLAEIDLKTGRTHQIRVHFSYLRWPLLGDKTYGGEEAGLGRPFLHAKSISFVHPTSGQELEFVSRLPDELIEIIRKYEEF